MVSVSEQPAIESDMKHAWRVLYVVLLSMLAMGFPFTVLTVAVKLIAVDFGISESRATWAISAPILISAVTMPLLGKLGDLHGHRRLFLVGILGSTIFAGLCFLAWNIWSLIFFRVMSMVLAGASGPASMAMIFHLFKGSERTKAVSWMAVGGSGSAAIGLILGGPLVDLFGWRSVFFFQIITGIIAYLFAVRLLPETERRRAVFDHFGNALLIVSLLLLLTAVGSIGEGTIRPDIWFAMIVLASIGLVMLWRFEQGVSEPVVPPFLFHERNFSLPVAASFISQVAYAGGMIITPILVVSVFGFSVTVAAGFMLIRVLSLTVAAPVAGRLSRHIGEKKVVLIGVVTQAVGLALVGAAASVVNVPFLAFALMVQGVGHAFILPPLTAVISFAIPSTHYGTATGVSRMIFQVGTSFGISLFGVLVSLGEDVISFPQIYAVCGLVSFLAILPATGISMKFRRPTSD